MQKTKKMANFRRFGVMECISHVIQKTFHTKSATSLYIVARVGGDTRVFTVGVEALQRVPSVQPHRTKKCLARRVCVLGAGVNDHIFHGGPHTAKIKTAQKKLLVTRPHGYGRASLARASDPPRATATKVSPKSDPPRVALKPQKIIDAWCTSTVAGIELPTVAWLEGVPTGMLACLEVQINVPPPPLPPHRGAALGAFQWVSTTVPYDL